MTEPRIELWHVAGCPRVDEVRAAVRDCLRETGVAATVRERVGPCPSPTLLVDGIDVATGTAPGGAVCCRLDLPTRDQIRAALLR